MTEIDLQARSQAGHVDRERRMVRQTSLKAIDYQARRYPLLPDFVCPCLLRQPKPSHLCPPARKWSLGGECHDPMPDCEGVRFRCITRVGSTGSLVSQPGCKSEQEKIGLAETLAKPWEVHMRIQSKIVLRSALKNAHGFARV